MMVRLVQFRALWTHSSSRRSVFCAKLLLSLLYLKKKLKIFMYDLFAVVMKLRTNAFKNTIFQVQKLTMLEKVRSVVQFCVILHAIK